MKRQPTWDKYEVALLISAYIKIKSGKEEKSAELVKLSEKLRRKAENEGLVIDETFRNLNGMQWQLGFIDCAFNNQSFGTHAPSKMFRKMVDMYQNEREAFDEILQMAEVKVMGEQSVCKIKNHSICNGDILQLISRKFMYGFRINSVIDMMKLRDYANDEGVTLYEEDEVLRNFIQANGIMMEGKVFIKTEDSRSELVSLVEGIFDKGNSIIYYESLIERHSKKLMVNEAYKKGNSRAGCLFCPMGGGKGDFLQYASYKEEVGKYIDMINSMNARNAGDIEGLRTYVSNGGWNARKNGRDLTINEQRYKDEIKDKKVIITVKGQRTDWREWIKTLGEIPFEFEYKETENGYQIICDDDVIKKYAAVFKKFKQVFRKAAYCVGCKVCETNCRNGCISCFF